ncbi:MAG: cytochrome P450, partial [Thermocrispum sp.]
MTELSGVSDHVEEVGAAFYADPHEAYRRWRPRGGAQRARFRDGTAAWVVSGYHEARDALADPRLAKSVPGAMD